MDRHHSQSSFVATTFTVVNLHCSSCVTNIEEALTSLCPSVSITHSIINHTVTVIHPPIITPSKLSRALDEAGFEIYSEADSKRASLRETLDQAVQRWGFLSPSLESRKRKRHLENCELCRTKSRRPSGTSRWSVQSEAFKPLTAVSTATRSPAPTVPDQFTKPLASIVTIPTDQAPQAYRATLSITGMTCSACSGSITGALEAKSFVQTCSINLLTHSATVDFYNAENKDKVVETIEDAGFEATIQELHSIGQEPSRTTVADVWKAELAITGMTCASCVGHVTKALEQSSWVQSVDVTLLTNSAKVIFEGKAHSAELTNLVEDIGFEAQLDKLEQVTSQTSEARQRRVLIKIDGMYCEDCPSRVLEHLSNLSGVTILRSPSYVDPIVEVEYKPDAPKLTIRSILESISNANDKFTATIHHPISLEERSRRMQSRERFHIACRLILSASIAIPTFIIGIVYMELISADDPNRRWLMEPVRGVRRADWAMFALATPIWLFAADLFHRRTLKELRALWRPGSPTPFLRRFYRFGSMNMLVSLGTSIAYVSSVAMVIVAVKHPSAADDMLNSNPYYFDSVVFLTLFLLLGRLIEAFSKAKTGDAISALGNLRPNTATLVTDPSRNDAEGQISSRTQQIEADLLEMGDVVRVVNGASPPSDGVIVDVTTAFDESSLTGESKLVTKSRGDQVFAGTVNKGVPVSVRVTDVSGTSMLDKIMSVVREGQAKRAPMERLADLLTAYFVPFITLVAVSTWAIWLTLGLTNTLPQDYLDVPIGGWAFWSLQFAIAVFVVACPCGLGLAAPTALFVGGGLAAKSGILVKGGGEAFQEASNLDIVAFDKTGTLTQGGEPKVVDSSLFAIEDTPEETVLSITRCLEEDSTHPVARAVVSHCISTSGLSSQSAAAAVSTEELPGRGMKGTVRLEHGDKVEALVGNEALMTDYQVQVSSSQLSTLHEWQAQGNSVALVAIKAQPGPWHLSAMFATADPLRPEAAAVIQALHAQKISVWMISGDNATTARAVGAQLDIPAEQIIAGVLPTEKASKIRYLQTSQARRPSRLAHLRTRLAHKLQIPALSPPSASTTRPVVAFVGDGINDAPALAAADVSVALGSGSDAALASASFILLAADLRALPHLLALSAAVFARVRANFAWACAYNAVALPVAAGALFALRGPDGAHVRLGPAWAALAMALSSVSVVLSSLALRLPVPFVGFRRPRWGEPAASGNGASLARTSDGDGARRSGSLGQRAQDAAAATDAAMRLKQAQGDGDGQQDGSAERKDGRVFVHAGLLDNEAGG